MGEGQQTYVINDKTYSKEQLIAFGKEHYPKFYWIPRVLGQSTKYKTFRLLFL